MLADRAFAAYSRTSGRERSAFLRKVASNITGHLTATIHGTERNLRDFGGLIEALDQKVGRLVFSFPTDVKLFTSWYTVVRIRRLRMDGRLLLAAMRCFSFLGPC